MTAATFKKSTKPLTPLPTNLRIEEDQSLLGPPPLIPFDDAAAYDKLLVAVTEAIAPMDFLELIWTRHIADLQWDIMRYRRIKNALIKEPLESDALAHVLHGADEDSQLTSVVASNIELIERVDRMIAIMENRRNAAYREAERRRINLGTRLRHAAEQVEDAEFSEVDDSDEQQRAA